MKTYSANLDILFTDSVNKVTNVKNQMVTARQILISSKYILTAEFLE